MKIELVCKTCNEKSFLVRAVSSSTIKRTKTYECKRCSCWIIIEYQKTGWKEGWKKSQKKKS
jgi:predicted SprT family Zn-dependent metalloprotease